MWDENEEEDDIIEPGSEQSLKLQKDFEAWNDGANRFFSENELEYLFRHYYQFEHDSDYKVYKIVELGLSIFPNSGFFQICMAKLQLDKNQIDDAIENLESAKLLDPLNQEIAVLLSECYEEKDNEQVALHILEEAESYIPEFNPDLQMRLISLLFSFERKEEATQKLATLLKFEMELDFLERGIYTMAFDFEDILNAWEILINKNPFDSKLWFAKGQTLLNEEDYDKAYEAFEYASLLNESDSESLFMMGLCMKELEFYDSARKLFARASELGYNRDSCILETSICMNRMKDFMQARFLLQPLLDKDFRAEEVLYEIGYSYLHESNPYKALPYIEKSREIFHTLIKDILISEIYWQLDELDKVYEIYNSSKNHIFPEDDLFFCHFFGLFFRMDDLKYMKDVANAESANNTQTSEEESLLQKIMRALIHKAEGKNKLYHLKMYECFAMDREEVLYYLERIDYELSSDPEIISIKELF
jgi:tetratricopeptide (TPR) repeat protein